jgi:hypothetical protein
VHPILSQKINISSHPSAYKRLLRDNVVAAKGGKYYSLLSKL